HAAAGPGTGRLVGRLVTRRGRGGVPARPGPAADRGRRPAAQPPWWDRPGGRRQCRGGLAPYGTVTPTGAGDDPASPDRTVADILTTLLRGDDLEPAAAAWMMDLILSGDATAVQIAGFAVALRSKGETVAELSGIADAMLSHAMP